jgi:hypothetical protein
MRRAIAAPPRVPKKVEGRGIWSSIRALDSVSRTHQRLNTDKAGQSRTLPDKKQNRNK